MIQKHHYIQEIEEKNNEGEKKYDFYHMVTKETLYGRPRGVRQLRMNHCLTLFKNTLHLILIPILMLSDIELLLRGKTSMNTNGVENKQKHTHEKNAAHTTKILLSTTLMPLYYFGFMACNILGIVFPIKSTNAYLHLERQLYNKECVVLNGIDDPELEIIQKGSNRAVTQDEVNVLKKRYGPEYRELTHEEILNIFYPWHPKNNQSNDTGSLTY